MSLNLYGKEYEEIKTATLDIPQEVNVFSDTSFNPDVEMTLARPSKIDEVFKRYDQKKDPSIQKENMKEVATNPFFEERTASTKDLAKEKLVKVRLKIAFSLYAFIFVMLFGFMIFNFVSTSNLNHAIEINNVRIESIERILEP